MRGEFIDPGAMRHELVLEEAVLSPDGAGGHSENWIEIALFFGRVEPVSAVSRFGADQTLESVTHRVTIRFRDGVTAGMRLRRAGRFLVIVTVHDPDETKRYLVCRARERLP